MIWDSFTKIFSSPLFGIKKLFANPMGLFVYGLLSKWYIMVLISTIVVTFWVFKGLQKAGVIEAAETVISKALTEAQAVAKYCVPKIANLKDFWHCLDNPPRYVPDKEGQDLEQQLKKAFPRESDNPYEEKE